jgi:hypothetical protein
MDPWEKKSRTLTQALIVSGALNIAFIGTLIAFSLKWAPVEQMMPESRKTPLVSFEVVSLYLPLNFEELVQCLTAKKMIEDGYLERDIALAILVEFHHFNLERALSGLSFEKRPVMFTNMEGGEEVHFTLFPGLTDGNFEALIHYAQKEKWPLTTQGLFLELKGGNRDPSLIEAFRLSREVDELYSLFRSDEVISMALEGDFQALSMPRKEMSEVLDRYLRFGSKVAVKFLFECDAESLIKRLDNQLIMEVLSKLDEGSPKIEAGLKLILSSPRPDEVRSLAGRQLHRFTGEVVAVTLQPSVRKHMIVYGDTLWELSKKYQVSIDQICEANHLEKGRPLKIGQELVIRK